MFVFCAFDQFVWSSDCTALSADRAAIHLA